MHFVIYITVVLMRSAGFGTCELGELPWSLTVTYRQFSQLNSHPMGSHVFAISQSIESFTFPQYHRYQTATGAGDDTIRIWDMRSLKSLYTIPAHLSNVSDIRFFHANDLHFDKFKNATSSKSPDVDMHEEGDNVARDTPEDDPSALFEEWRYRSGLFFASSGYDGLVKLWSADDWQLLRTLSTDAGKVMSVDISSDGNLLASGTYNRNFQLFAPQDV